MDNKIIHTATTKTGKTVSFRYPTIADVEILKDHINKLSAEKTFINFQGEKKTLKDEKKWLSGIIKKINKNECVSILAFINNNFAGSSEIELKDLARMHVGGFGITIAKEFRGEGIGSLLMDLVIKESVKNIRELKIITLECFATNIIAVNLYKKMGFIEYGRLPYGLKRLGEFVDEILMYKKIN